MSQIKTGAQPPPNNVSSGAAGQREPRHTAKVTGRQHPAQIKLEGVICLCLKNKWLERLCENKISAEGHSKNKRGKTSYNTTRETGRIKTEKTMAVIKMVTLDFRWD